MHMLLDGYVVSDVRSVDEEPAPPEIRERFEGRTFTLRELEERGVRITGGTGWFMALGRDFQLNVRPAL